MISLVQKLRSTISDHVQVASAADIIAITSTLCGAGEEHLGVLGHATVRELPRFEAQGDIVNDSRTGLIWSRENVPGGQMKWKEAQKACEAMRIGGYSDWRMPTIRELLSLVDYEKSSPAIDPAFKCEPAAYWSATAYAPSPGDLAWVVNFDGGYSDWYLQSNEYFVRAVRAGQLIGNWGW